MTSSTSGRTAGVRPVTRTRTRASNPVARLSAVLVRIEQRRRMLHRLANLVEELDVTGLAAVSGDRDLLLDALRQLAGLRRRLAHLADLPAGRVHAELDAMQAALDAAEPWRLVEESASRLAALRSTVRAAIGD